MSNSVSLLSAIIDLPADKVLHDAGKCTRCKGFIAQGKPLFFKPAYSCIMCGEEYGVSMGKFVPLYGQEEAMRHGK